MPKKLVIFCDGTWNAPTEYSTNVLRLMEAAAFEDDKGLPQVAHYVPGVGTRWGERLRGGAFGYGISDAIRNAYSFIVGNYETGDEIFLFGFSRGAYTARSLAGLIHNLGILKRQHMPLVAQAYDNYKDRSDAWHPDGPETKLFRDKYTHGGETIRFLGVWDTVGSLGAPFGAITGWVVDKIFQTSFHSVTLSESVESACHAIAVDETRWPFRPTLWKLTPLHESRNKAAMEAGHVPPYEEKWFPGAHSDVGGGNQHTGLSDLALEWMADRAGLHGLKTDLGRIDDLFHRKFQKDLTTKLESKQNIFYRLATAAMVKWPSFLSSNLVFPKDSRDLVEHVTPLGDYVRPIAADQDASLAREKKKVDPSYDPPNLR